MTEYYSKLFARQWWIVALCVVCVGAGAFLGSRFLGSSSSLYSSSSLVEAQFVGTYNDTNGYMATEAKLCTSSRILSTIVGNYAGMTESTLAGEISANVLTGTHLVQITVTDASAARAAKIANDVANALIADQQQVGQQFGSQAAQQIQSQLSSLQNQINQTTSDLNQAIQSNNQSSIANLESQLSSLREQQALLQFSLTQMQLSLSEGTPTLSLAQQAQPASTPAHSIISSASKYAVAGILLGLVLGVALVLVLDALVWRRSGAPAAEPAEVASTK